MIHKHIVACVLLTPDTRIVLQSRQGISKYGEERSFFGWHQEEWESITQTVMRELSEELDLKISANDITYIWDTIHIIWDQIEYHRAICIIHISDATTLQDREWAGAYVFDIDQVRWLKFNTSIDRECDMIQKYIDQNFEEINLSTVQK